MPQGEQVKNGKAFEYALANQYYIFLQAMEKSVELVENSALEVARNFYYQSDIEKRKEFDIASKQTIETLLKIEPGLYCKKGRHVLMLGCRAYKRGVLNGSKAFGQLVGWQRHLSRWG